MIVLGNKNNRTNYKKSKLFIWSINNKKVHSFMVNKVNIDIIIV